MGTASTFPWRSPFRLPQLSRCQALGCTGPKMSAQQPPPRPSFCPWMPLLGSASGHPGGRAPGAGHRALSHSEDSVDHGDGGRLYPEQGLGSATVLGSSNHRPQDGGRCNVSTWHTGWPSPPPPAQPSAGPSALQLRAPVPPGVLLPSVCSEQLGQCHGRDPQYRQEAQEDTGGLHPARVGLLLPRREPHLEGHAATVTERWGAASPRLFSGVGGAVQGPEASWGLGVWGSGHCALQRASHRPEGLLQPDLLDAGGPCAPPPPRSLLCKAGQHRPPDFRHLF